VSDDVATSLCSMVSLFLRSSARARLNLRVRGPHSRKVRRPRRRSVAVAANSSTARSILAGALPSCQFYLAVPIRLLTCLGQKFSLYRRSSFLCGRVSVYLAVRVPGNVYHQASKTRPTVAVASSRRPNRVAL